MRESGTGDEPGVLTTARLSTSATPRASNHVERARLARQAAASQASAAADPEGDAPRVLAKIYASTPTTIFRPGALAEHCGLTEDRARDVIRDLVDRGLLSAGATTTMVSIVGPALVERIVGSAS